MSMSRNSSKFRNQSAPRASFPERDPKLMLIKQRINHISSNIKSPLNYSSSSISHARETRIRTPPKKEMQEIETIEDFLLENGLEKYVELFQDNQITLQDLPMLTKEDLIDMKMPIVSRNRLLKIIENMNNSKREIISNYESSPKRSILKDEVDKFMNELSQFSKRSDHKLRPSSREQSLETSFETESNSQKIYDNIIILLRDICEKTGIYDKSDWG